MNLEKEESRMSTQSILDPEHVITIFIDCLSRYGEDISKCVVVEGIRRTVEFHPGRLRTHKAEIEAMLDELPDQFKRSGGGGWSFLCAHNDKHGNQWARFHHHAEQLFELGIGIGKVQYRFPREMWPILAGGMPYYVIG